jgi:hypothetical protein
MQHLFNVLEPLAADNNTLETLKVLIDSGFDNNLFVSGTVLALNLKATDVNGDFRMNERIFRYQMCADEAKHSGQKQTREKSNLPANI